MLLSWKTYFFVALETGVSVTVDKITAGFCVQDISAAIFGANIFALDIPQVRAGNLSIPLVFSLVNRPFGRTAGLVAAGELSLILGVPKQKADLTPWMKDTRKPVILTLPDTGDRMGVDAARSSTEGLPPVLFDCSP